MALSLPSSLMKKANGAISFQARNVETSFHHNMEQKIIAFMSISCSSSEAMAFH